VIILNYIILFFYNIFIGIKTLFYHNKCSYCEQIICDDDVVFKSICRTCIKTILPIAPMKHKKTNYIIYALGKYDGVLRHIIVQKYYKSNFGYDALEDIILETLQKNNVIFDCIVLVPKTSINRVKQQVSPGHSIANIMKKYHDADIFELVFMRNLKSDQAGKRYMDRILFDVRNFFIPRSAIEKLKNKHIIIVDDVYTTGSTIDGMLNAIKNLGCASITIFVLARK
jgi:predicted amidophosphoribosyltransferase